MFMCEAMDWLGISHFLQRQKTIGTILEGKKLSLVLKVIQMSQLAAGSVQHVRWPDVLGRDAKHGEKWKSHLWTCIVGDFFVFSLKYRRVWPKHQYSQRRVRAPLWSHFLMPDGEPMYVSAMQTPEPQPSCKLPIEWHDVCWSAMWLVWRYCRRFSSKLTFSFPCFRNLASSHWMFCCAWCDFSSLVAGSTSPS